VWGCFSSRDPVAGDLLVRVQAGGGWTVLRRGVSAIIAAGLHRVDDIGGPIPLWEIQRDFFSLLRPPVLFFPNFAPPLSPSSSLWGAPRGRD